MRKTFPLTSRILRSALSTSLAKPAPSAIEFIAPAYGPRTRAQPVTSLMQHMGLRGSRRYFRYWDWHCVDGRDADDLGRGLVELSKAINLER
jgi:hypothetical protein